jgi:hypothetical protein
MTLPLTDPFTNSATNTVCNSILFTAPSNAANATVTATIMATSEGPSQTLNVPFKVFEPSGLGYATITATFPHTFGPGIVAAAMHLDVYVAPTNVSFYRLMCVEIGEDATNLWGSLTNIPNASSIYTHKGGPGKGLGDKWFPIDADNSWFHQGDDGWDTCYLVWPGNYPGGFTWPIPAAWRVEYDGGTGHTNLHFSDQVFSIDAFGTMTIQKFGTNVTRTTNDITIPSL